MFHGPEPIYLQIAEFLRHQILTGTLQVGDQVMSTTQFATTFQINPATAAKAFTLLVDEGLIHKQRGLGMFVSPGAPEKLRATARAKYFAEVFEPAIIRGALLGLTQQELASQLTLLWPDAAPLPTSQPDSPGEAS